MPVNNTQLQSSQEEEVRTKVIRLPSEELKFALLTVLNGRTGQTNRVEYVQNSLNVYHRLNALGVNLEPSLSEKEQLNKRGIEAADLAIKNIQKILAELKDNRQELSRDRQKEVPRIINEIIRGLNNTDLLIDHAIVTELAKKVYTQEIISPQKAAELYIAATSKSDLPIRNKEEWEDLGFHKRIEL